MHVKISSAKWRPFCLGLNELRCEHMYRTHVDWQSEPITCMVKETTSQWRHNEFDGVSNHGRLGCLLNRLFRDRSKKSSKLRVTGLCEGNSPVTNNPMWVEVMHFTLPLNETQKMYTTKEIQYMKWMHSIRNPFHYSQSWHFA